MLLIMLSFLQAAMNVGQAVEIRDFGASDWSPGRIVGVQRQSDGLHYRVEHKRGNFTVETDYPAAMVRGAGGVDQGASSAPFAIGDEMEIRDHASEQWQAGEVVGIDPVGSDAWRYRVRYRGAAGEVENVFYADRIRQAGALPRSASAVPGRSASGQIVPGAYACTHDYWTGAMPYRQRHSDPVGTITFAANGSYRWLSNGGGGNYRLDPASGALTFLTGPVAAKQPKSASYRVNQRTTQVDISFADGVDWSCGHNL